MTMGLLGGSVRDPGAPTINEKNINSGPLGPCEGGVDLHRGSKRCVINLHEYERQKVILLMDPTFPAPGPAMAYDP
jgi:hypothetical protein